MPKEFELIKIDNYLQKYVNADQHFFSKEENEIKATLNFLIGAIFFVERKICKHVLVFGEFFVCSDYFFVHFTM